MIKRLGVLFVFILSCFACGKASDYVPNVSVNFQMALSDPRLSALKVTNGAVVIPGYGVAGLILYRRADGSYAAYDRCSPYLPQNKCAVTVDSPSFTCSDPCSTSKWLLQDGTPVKAPAVKSLKEYSVNVSAFEIFVQN